MVPYLGSKCYKATWLAQSSDDTNYRGGDDVHLPSVHATWFPKPTGQLKAVMTHKKYGGGEDVRSKATCPVGCVSWMPHQYIAAALGTETSLWQQNKRLGLRCSLFLVFTQICFQRYCLK